MEKTNYDAYWINPEGEITGAPVKHILQVLHYPDYFGYTLDGVQNRFKKFGERLGWEGRAREEIFKELFTKGWIRVRKNKDHSISIQTGKYSETEKKYVAELAKIMLKFEGNDQYSVNITTLEGDEIITSLSVLLKIKA